MSTHTRTHTDTHTPPELDTQEQLLAELFPVRGERPCKNTQLPQTLSLFLSLSLLHTHTDTHQRPFFSRYLFESVALFSLSFFLSLFLSLSLPSLSLSLSL